MSHQFFLPPNKMPAVRGHVPSFDGLRGANVLIVVFSHGLLGAYSKLIPGGLAGYIFFVISGFLITRLIFLEYKEMATISLSAFYVRRVIRLFPAVIVFTVIFVACYALLGRPINLMEPLSALAYFNNYYGLYVINNDIPLTMPPFSVFWSLSLEEHFYFLFPIVFLFLRGNVARLMWLMVGICIACFSWRLLMRLESPQTPFQSFYSLTEYRMDSIAYGVILALLCESPRGRDWVVRLAAPKPFAWAAAGLLACLVVRNQFFRDTIRYSIEGIVLTVMLAGVLFDSRHRFLQWFLNTKILTWFGRLSYSWYVWHEGIFYLLPTAAYPQWQQVPIKFGGSLAAAVLSYHLVEMPVQSLRRRFRPEKSHKRPDKTPVMATVGAGHEN
jgi:peptidoglycan/LPS O-acetylase OafA/YrhL